MDPADQYAHELAALTVGEWDWMSNSPGDLGAVGTFDNYGGAQGIPVPNDNNDPAFADSVPNLDAWGPDNWWTLAEWKMWHQANVARYGQAQANETFISWWRQQSFGAGPENQLENDPDLRAYFRNAGLLNRMGYTLGGAITDFVQGAGQAVNALPGTTQSFGWIIPIGLALLALGYIAPAITAGATAASAVRKAVSRK